jgi:hypothetical protein
VSSGTGPFILQEFTGLFSVIWRGIKGILGRWIVTGKKICMPWWPPSGYLLLILVAVISGLHYFDTVTWALLFCLISLSHRRTQHRPLILMFSYLSIFICIYINSITQSCSLDVWFNWLAFDFLTFPRPESRRRHGDSLTYTLLNTSKSELSIRNWNSAWPPASY